MLAAGSLVQLQTAGRSTGATSNPGGSSTDMSNSLSPICGTQLIGAAAWNRGAVPSCSSDSLGRPVDSRAAFQTVCSRGGELKQPIALGARGGGEYLVNHVVAGAGKPLLPLTTSTSGQPVGRPPAPTYLSVSGSRVLQLVSRCKSRFWSAILRGAPLQK